MFLKKKARHFSPALEITGKADAAKIFSNPPVYKNNYYNPAIGLI